MGCLVFIFTLSINSKSFPWPVHSAPEICPKSFLRRTQHHGMLRCHNNDGLSGHGLVTSVGEGKGRSFSNIMENWIMTQFAIILLNDLSFPSPALTTAHIAALSVIGTLATQQ